MMRGERKAREEVMREGGKGGGDGGGRKGRKGRR